MLENASFRQISSNENMVIVDDSVINNGSVSKVGIVVDDERSRESIEDGGGDRNNNSAAGNRWPREETLALVKVRSDMVNEFRDAGVTKAPLWDEVSRKLAELGYHRSAKKCKEKFENIYKYHRRTKEGRTSNLNVKSYHFFEELEAFDQINPSSSIQTPPTIVSQPLPMISSNSTNSYSGREKMSEEKEMKIEKKKNKVMGDFFEKLMNEVISKQEQLQNSFIESIEKYEQERIRREDSWKIQQKAQQEREQKLLVKDRAIAAAKDAAVITFLQKFTGNKVDIPESILTPTVKTTSTDETMQENSRIATQQIVTRPNNNDTSSSSSRWPRHEVEALIAIRSTFYDEQSDQEIANGNKGPLWEEISTTMNRLHGYERSAKRCKEKWENINKYFKRVRESNKRRPEDSKTCPYFHQLEALYKRKKTITTKKVDHDHNKSYDFKAEELLMQMMGQSEPGEINNQINVEGDAHDNDNDNVDDENTDEEDDDDTENYQIVANDTSTTAIME